MTPVPFSGNSHFNQIFFVSYLAWILFEVVTGISRRAKGTNRRDRGSFFILVALVWFGIFLDFTFVYSIRRGAIPWVRTEIFFVGIALMWIGIIFRYYCMRVLGRFFTFDVAVHGGQTVVESGPYRYIRHPSYTGAMVTLFGFGLTLGNWLGLLALIVCTAGGYFYRIKVEETALVGALGEPYREYMTRTKRLVPFLI